MGEAEFHRSIRLSLATMIKNLTPASSNFRQSDGFWTGTDRLDSWKEIATYLRREVRTVQLWEKKEGLPVHRHFHKRLGSVFALRSEIENWKRQVSRVSGEQETTTAVEPVRPESRIIIYVLPLMNVTVTTDRRRLCD